MADHAGTRRIRAILEGTPYPVRGLMGFGANMLLSQADGGRGRVALAALDRVRGGLASARSRQTHDAAPSLHPAPPGNRTLTKI